MHYEEVKTEHLRSVVERLNDQIYQPFSEMKTTATQGSQRIDFSTKVNGQETGKMLRTSFPVAIRTDSASCEIQFGYPTDRNTLWDYANDEICAYQWMDLWERPDYSVELLNDSNNGHQAWQNAYDLNLLRSTSYPDPEVDLEEHGFTYSLYPHKEDHVKAKVYKHGCELSVPLRLVRVNAGDAASKLPEAWLADLMETTIDRLHVDDGVLQLSFTPLEITTIRLARRQN